MKKAPNFKAMFEEIEKSRGIKEEDLITALKDALMSAAKKRFPDHENLDVQISPDGAAKIFDKGKEVTPADFGRLAAQTAKQVITQRLREAEKEVTFEEYSGKVGELINVTVQRREGAGYLINLGRIETFLPISEAIPGEILNPKERVKLLILEVKKTSKGPLIVVSRSHPDFVKKLFYNEIPEFEQGILEIKSIAREPGRRTKVAVFSNDKDVGAVSTCVGPMGSRIQSVTHEMGPERVDIIEWSEKPEVFIANALAPAKAAKVVVNEPDKSSRVTLPERELSLAIGKEGQNVRLAARLTGYRIDILGEGKKT